MSLKGIRNVFGAKTTEQVTEASRSSFFGVESLPWEGVYIWANEENVAS